MVDATASPQAIAAEAERLFAPMLAQWRHQPHPEPSLAGTVADHGSAYLLEKDFRDIGAYIIGADGRGTRIELGVLVDCIVELRGNSGENNAALNAAQLADEFEIVKHKNAESSFLPPPVVLSLPLCLRVARDLERLGVITEAERLKDILVAFVHRIVLQDGNVTAKEISVATEIEDYLTDMIRNAA